MNEQRTLIATVVFVVAISAGIWLLATGGPGSLRTADPRGDVQLGEGSQPPSDREVADIVDASVESVGRQLVFRARAATDIPDDEGRGAISWRWEIAGDDDVEWLVVARVGGGTMASISNSNGDYATSTVDETMPGSLHISGSSVEVRLERGGVPGLPGEFTWQVRSALDADRFDPATALVSDVAPDSGPAAFPAD